MRESVHSAPLEDRTRRSEVVTLSTRYSCRVMAAAVATAPLQTLAVSMDRRRGLPLKRRYSDTSGEEEEEEEEGGEVECWPIPYADVDLLQPRQSKSARVVSNPYLTTFFLLFEDDVVQDFLWVDSCARVADKYLLAMVYVYFRRARLPVEQYHRNNFFAALYLANDMEEDEDEEKYEIFPWALGEDWLHKFSSFLRQRDCLWYRMNCRAVVSRKTCEEVIRMAPHHQIWQRCRRRHHGGAIRAYAKPPSPRYGRTSPVYCETCTRLSVLELSGGGDGGRREEGRECSRETSAEREAPRFNDLLDEIDFSTGVVGSEFFGGSFQLATAPATASGRDSVDKWQLPPLGRVDREE